MGIQVSAIRRVVCVFMLALIVATGAIGGKQNSMINCGLKFSHASFKNWKGIKMSSRNMCVSMSALIFLLLNASAGYSQEQKIGKKGVPKPVLSAFQNSYPKAVITGFSKETEKGVVVYEVESVEGKTHRDVTYAANGSVITIEESLAYADAPAAIRDAMAKDFPKARIIISEKVIKGSATQYEFLVSSGKKKLELVYDAAGKLVEKEKK